MLGGVVGQNYTGVSVKCTKKPDNSIECPVIFYASALPPPPPQENGIFIFKKSIEDNFIGHLKFSPDSKFIVTMIKNHSSDKPSIYRIKLDDKFKKDEPPIGDSMKDKFIVVKKDEKTLFVITGVSSNKLIEVTTDSLNELDEFDDKIIDAFDYSQDNKKTYACQSQIINNESKIQIIIADMITYYSGGPGKIVKLLFSQDSLYIIALFYKSNGEKYLFIRNLETDGQYNDINDNDLYFTFYGDDHILFYSTKTIYLLNFKTLEKTFLIKFEQSYYSMK